jgi:hypothetical protein
MPQFERTITVKLSPAEAENIIREALQLPAGANVRFTIGSVGHEFMGDRSYSQGVTGVEVTYKEGGAELERGGQWDR